MKNEYVMTVREAKQEILGRLEYDFFTNKPCTFDKTFETEDEAIEYEFTNDEMYDPIRQLEMDDKIVMFWNENNDMCFRTYQIL